MDWPPERAVASALVPLYSGKEWALERKLTKKHERVRIGVLAVLWIVVNPRSPKHHSSGIVIFHARARTANGAADDRIRLLIAFVMLE